MRSLSVCIVFFTFSLSGIAATYHVPDDFGTIQGAISDPGVVSGDVIIVRAGIYNEQLDFLGKAITLTSDEGAVNTFINGNQGGSTVSFKSWEGYDTILEGFTITNGLADRGGGIYCYVSSPTIRNNVITQNESDYLGGGICCISCAPLINDNLIEKNDSYHGGGIGMDRYSSPIIRNNTLQNNNADWKGGGCACLNSNPMILDNTFYRNTCNKYGGAICGAEGASMMIIGNQIIHNKSKVYAGGIMCSSQSTFHIADNLITENIAGIYGGGLFVRRTVSVTIQNCVISNNLAEVNGGGIYFMIDTPGPSYMSNCVIYGNQALNTGGGFYSKDKASQEVTNTIIRNNSAPASPQVYITQHYPGQFVTKYCNVEGGMAGECNFDDDPAFVDPADNDFHLIRTSCCINRGTTEGAPTRDIDGDARPCMGSVDVGVDEFIDIHPLEADKFEISISYGGTVNFTIDAGPQNGGREYMLLGSQSGTTPGTSLYGQITLPLNYDAFTSFVMANLNSTIFTNFNSLLDAQGKGTAQYNAGHLPAGYLGLVSHFAYYLVGAPWDFVSNPVAVTYVN